MPDSDLVNKIIKYEDGEMDEEETTALFQELIDTGIVWHLQGSYGATAMSLITAGVCHITNKQ